MTPDSAILQGPFPDWFSRTGIGDWLQREPVLVPVAGVLLLLAAAWIAHRVAGRYLLRAIRRAIQASRVDWDDVLLEHGIFERLANVVPVVVIYSGIALVPGVPTGFEEFVRRVGASLLVWVVALALGRLLDASDDLYVRVNPQHAARPIKGYIQIGKLILYLLAGILAVAVLLERSPWVFLSGIGALTAVLLLIFRDTILSFVASIQIASNDLLRVGDWIEVPRFGADGDVIDIALHTVKVQNFDRTITTIPTYKLLEESFRNWRGMQESGARRIKRSVVLDVGTIRFLTPGELEALSRWERLEAYLSTRMQEIEVWNALPPSRPELRRAERRLTNVGTFRAYVEAYLRAHPRIRQDASLMVRQQPAAGEGLPLELYCFTDTTVWAEYEGIQSDIFDHIYSILPAFHLRAFQSPTGGDFRALRPESPPE